jgi:ubiquinone/menaquinone biosynthesis C-methylase UbiE
MSNALHHAPDGDHDAGQPLPAAEAYRIWAPTYDAENAVTTLEDSTVRAMMPDLEGRSLLDVGCGTARRLRADLQPRLAVGVDLVFDMLSAGRTLTALLVAADVRALPIRASTFDVVWCRLVLGHVDTLETAYAELGRVARRGAQLIVTDFHPAAALAGHTRSFVAASGDRHVVRHCMHLPDQHASAAAAGGWELVETIDAAVGPISRPFYEAAGAIDRYDAQFGMPLVLALRYAR